MAAFMRTVGSLAVRFRYAIVVVWAAAAALCVVFLPSLASVTNPDNTSFLPSDTGTAKAIDLAAPFVPPGQSSATLVATRSDGKLTPTDQSAFRDLEAAVAKVPHVVSVNDQGVSSDGKVQKALVVVSVATGSTDAGDVVDDIRAQFASVDDPGLSEYLTGQLAASVDNQRSQEDAQRLTEILSNVVILVMLFIVLRALVAPIVTLLPAVTVLTLASPVIAEASKAGIEISSVTHPMLTVLLLGAGTDYGLFLVLRMREEMERGAAPRAAIVRAVERVGESITFSAGTVIVALLCLIPASFGLYSGLGPALAIGVALMLLAGLTLLPALLAICGGVLFWPRKLRLHENGEEPDTGWIRVVNHVLTRPKTTLAVGVAVFLALASGIAGYSSNGFGGSTTGPSGSQSAAGQDVLNDHYPPAVASPTMVLLKYQDPIWQHLDDVDDAEKQLTADPEFSSVNGLFNPNGQPLSVSQVSQLYQQLGPPGKLPATEPAGTPVPADQYAGYRALAQFVSSDGRTVQFYTALSAGPADSTAALDAVPDIRSAVTDVQKSTGASESGVNGLAPASYDVSQVSDSDLEEIVPIVLVLIAVLLSLVMRSLIAPLYLVVSVALSYFAALGLAVIVYVGLGSQSGLDFVLPFLMFVFLMALGEDYNILVMSRIREEAHRLRLRDAVSRAMHATGTTVTSAGLILAATFGVSALTGATEEIKQLGGAIAMGIVLDTFFVRVLLVPATVILLGRWNWWPSALSRQSPRPAPEGDRGAPPGAAGS